MSVEVSRKELQSVPTLVVRGTTASTEIAKTLAEMFGAVWSYAQKKAVPLAGPPFARYLTVGRGTFSIEAGLPVAAPVPGEGSIVASELPRCHAAVAVHVGAYEKLESTHAAVARWLAENHLEAGAPWEVYLTDPGTTPDPAEWRTEVIYPLQA